MVHFEVDTAGLVDTATFRVARAILPELHYTPAENKRRRVRQVVMQQFQFALQR